MTDLCSVPTCTDPVRDSGYCSRHVQKWRTYGDPLAGRTNAPAHAGHVMKNGRRRTMINLETKFDHIRLAEKAIGKPLPRGAQVHHGDCDLSHNEGNNLVICPNARYHKLLHIRTNALNAGCPAHWRKCRFCKQHDDPLNLFICKSGNVHHRRCMNAYYRAQRQEKTNAQRTTAA